MTVDERLEFLLKSTESLHAAMHEMFERIDRERERNDGEHVRLESMFNERFDRLLGVVEVIAEATRNHQRRISDLERRQ